MRYEIKIVLQRDDLEADNLRDALKLVYNKEFVLDELDVRSVEVVQIVE